VENRAKCKFFMSLKILNADYFSINSLLVKYFTFNLIYVFVKLMIGLVLRIRNKGFGSGSGLKLVSDQDPVSDPDSNPDPNLGSGSRSETGQIFFCPKIFTHSHLQGCPPSAL
jgi:hypothetical protein